MILAQDAMTKFKEIQLDNSSLAGRHYKMVELQTLVLITLLDRKETPWIHVDPQLTPSLPAQ